MNLSTFGSFYFIFLGETKSTKKKPTRNTENSTESFRAISNPITHADVKGSYS